MGPRRVEHPRVGPRRVGHRRVGGPKFRAFFSLSRHNFHSFFSLSWGSFRRILMGFLKRRGPEMCTFGVLGRSYQPSDATGFLTVGPRTTTVPFWSQLDVAKNGLTRSLRVSLVAPVWLSLQAKSRAGGLRKAVISSVSWRKRKRGENPAICGPEHAKLGGTGGRRSWPAVLQKLLPCRS